MKKQKYKQKYKQGANNMLKVKLRKWGNSYGIRLPIQVLKAKNLVSQQTEFELTVDGQHLILTPIINKEDDQ